MDSTFPNMFKRIIAIGIDFFIMGIVSMLLLKFCTNFMSYTEIYAIIYIIGIIYFSGCESSKMQATIGKMLFGIIVTDLDGNRITIFRALIRTITKYLAAIVFLFIKVRILAYMHIIECAVAFFTPKKQALHDIIADTVVVNRNKS